MYSVLPCLNRRSPQNDTLSKFARLSIASLVFLPPLLRSPLAQARYSVTDEDAMGPGSPRVVVLHDNVAGAEAAIAPTQGGELSSFKVTRNGQMVELLYNARNYNPPPGTFHGRGPLLWPAVGAQYPVDTAPKKSCGMGSYTVGGKSYPMPCHGFAKDMPWQEVSRSADAHGARVTVELHDSDATRKYYPFAFHLDATFELSNGAVTVDYVVNSDASNSGPMPFSIGNHLGFNIPLLKGSDPSEVKFETQNTVQMLRNTVGVLNGESKPRSFDPPEALGSFRCPCCTAACRLPKPTFLAAHRSLRPHSARDANCHFHAARAAHPHKCIRRHYARLFLPRAMVWRAELAQHRRRPS